MQKSKNPQSDNFKGAGSAKSRGEESGMSFRENEISERISMGHVRL